MRKEKMSQEDEKIARMLDKVKNRLLVFSGKGGVGKSTVAANLALALSQKGLQVGLLDVDIHGPNLAKMLGVDTEPVEILKKQMTPVSITENLKLISMAFFFRENRYAGGMARSFKNESHWAVPGRCGMGPIGLAHLRLPARYR